MADALTNIAKIINSPPGQLAAGGVLAGIVWKFFERVEAVLTDHTKFEIAVWLLDRKKLSPTFQNWPDTFTKVFDRVFGHHHLSWQCFSRSWLLSISVFVISLIIVFATHWSDWRSSDMSISEIFLFGGSLIAAACTFGAVPDYLSLLITRFILGLSRRASTTMAVFLLVPLDLYLTLLLFTVAKVIGTAVWADMMNNSLFTGTGQTIRGVITFESIVEVLGLKRLVLEFSYEGPLPYIFLVPACCTSLWLWLYAGSGFILKGARRFDIGFDWFNRKFDIEKKPLQSIGLVAGALVALVYWTAVIVSRVVG